MKNKLFTTSFLLLALLLFRGSPAAAHGGATITVEPDQVAPGEEITLSGNELEDGEVFSLTLLGLFDSFELGSVEVHEESFSIKLIIPSEAQPGLYTLQAISEEGEALEVELTVLEGAGDEHADDGDHAEDNVVSVDATAEKMSLGRSRSTIEWTSAVTIVLFAGIAGLWILRKA